MGVWLVSTEAKTQLRAEGKAPPVAVVFLLVNQGNLLLEAVSPHADVSLDVAGVGNFHLPYFGLLVAF